MACPNKNRERSVTVGFRVTPEEARRIDALVAISGMTKQDYIVARLKNEEVTVVPNSRVQKALTGAMGDVLAQLRRIADGCPLDGEAAWLAERVASVFCGLGPGPVEAPTAEPAPDPMRELIMGMARA